MQTAQQCGPAAGMPHRGALVTLRQTADNNHMSDTASNPSTPSQPASEAKQYSFSKDASADRYLAHHGDNVAGLVSFLDEADQINVTHTVVDDAHQGQGLAGRLVEFALTDLRDSSDKPITATCSYVQLWLQRHPEFAETLAR
ncbi:N-acetyltransferase [Gulosibacter macacae]|uniref:N-acetyltransferase n=2 Tax=Gulosibacter macacae TaxID=2488791 RepID=A0A3P3VT58_9MICO|nr:N-acetyltransferase [Gulosibacter macacae]